MKIAIVQTSIFWENPEKNRASLTKKINAISETVDLIVLPEMFTTGFSMQPKNVAETQNGATVQWMQQLAKEKKSAVCGSLIISENNAFFNRLVFVHPNQKVEFYNKRHLFSYAGEDLHYTKGNSKTIVQYKGFAICLQICYDLRFPVFARNQENFDVLLYVANWPKPRTTAWNILLQARAIENMCYVIGVNRTGTDDNNHAYIGNSKVIDALGNHVLDAQEEESVFITQISKNHLIETRKKFPFLKDQDEFEMLD